jgi:hypothetical protein
VIGGTHGPGTRGFQKLLQENPFSRRQLEQLQEFQDKVCQILARVSVNNDHTIKKTSIDKVNVIDIFTS